MSELVTVLIAVLGFFLGGVLSYAVKEYIRMRKRIHWLENNYAAILTWLRVRFPLEVRDLEKSLIPLSSTMRNGNGQ